MKKIPLTKGSFTLVDDEDYDWLTQWKWYVSHGYANRTEYKNNSKRIIHMHREIAKTPEGYDTDHIDSNGLNNQRANLRICLHIENTWNQKIKSNNKSGIKGVYWSNAAKKWVAQICYKGKIIYLGCFSDINDSASAYRKASQEYFKEFAKDI